MRTLKMSLANIQGKMNRKEMRNIMAGSGSNVSCLDSFCNWDTDCCPIAPYCSGTPKSGYKLVCSRG